MEWKCRPAVGDVDMPAMLLCSTLLLPPKLQAPLVLGEGASCGVTLAALPVCLAGVVLVARPTFLFGSGAQALDGIGVGLAILQVGAPSSGLHSLDPSMDSQACMHPCMVSKPPLPRLSAMWHALHTLCPQAVLMAGTRLVVRSLGKSEPVSSIAA